MKQDWRLQGACKDLPQSEVDKIFNVGPGQSANRALLFCGSCPVRKECMNFALIYNESGIWAGTTDAERDAIPEFIKDELRTRGAAEWGGLESRNLNDFISQPRRIFADPLPEPEPEPVQLMALARQYEDSSDLPAYG